VWGGLNFVNTVSKRKQHAEERRPTQWKVRANGKQFTSMG